jgi:integrase
VRAKPNTLASNISSKLHYLKKFSLFLEEQFIYRAEQINDQVFEAFGSELSSRKLKQRTIQLAYQSLKDFFNVCRLEGWLDISTYWFTGKTKIIRTNNDDIDYIPEEVWNQLDQNLHYFPEPVQRMVLTQRVLGLRVGELCNMPFDCLRQRNEGWRIRFTTEKYNTIDELPIATPELVAVIREQQEYIRQNFGDGYDKLFCTNSSTGINSNGLTFKPVPKIMLGCSYNKWLNRLAKQCEIRSKDGELWHFRSHQFRRTVATVMTNAGIRDLIIMKYLRHRSLDMVRYYAHLLKTVLGDEYEELMREKKYVDITGKVVDSYKAKNPVTELLRRKMHQISTQYGECHRPILNSPCQTVNACWRCQHWCTSTDDLYYLRDDFKRVEQELQIAERLGMVRQEQGLKGDHESLLNRIKGLEAISDGS